MSVDVLAFEVFVTGEHAHFVQQGIKHVATF